MLQKLSWIILGTSGCLYITISLLLLWGQSRLIFIPDSQVKSTPEKYKLTYQDIWIDINKEKIHGWWIPAGEEATPVILYFHGNASNNGDIVDNADVFHQLGLSVLLVDYRGYGKSSSIFPNETRVYQDATAAWEYLTQTRKIEPNHIFVYGHSLGGAIAIELASKQPNMAGLITEGTFTSIKEMGSINLLFRLLPLDLIVTQAFDSINKISSLKTPLLMFHGGEDEMIPMEMAKQLFDKASPPKKLIQIPQAEHDNLHKVGDPQYIANLKQFIQENYPQNNFKQEQE